MISKLVILAVIVTVISAEPPRRLNSRFSERIVGMKPPSPFQQDGWKPVRAPLRFPERQEASPRPEYGPPETPKPVYGPPPKPEYGPPPKPEYGPPPKPVYGPPPQKPIAPTEPSLTTEIPTTINPDAEVIGDQNTSLQNGEFGQYYIYHPGGLLQKVRYATVDDMRNMEFSAKLRYENVNPIKGPIYTYDPETYVFSLLK